MDCVGFSELSETVVEVPEICAAISCRLIFNVDGVRGKSESGQTVQL